MTATLMAIAPWTTKLLPAEGDVATITAAGAALAVPTGAREEQQEAVETLPE